MRIICTSKEVMMCALSVEKYSISNAFKLNILNNGQMCETWSRDRAFGIATGCKLDGQGVRV
jgi:hypothetical protein